MRGSAIVIPVVALRRIVVGLLALLIVLALLVVARQNNWRIGLGDIVAPGIASQIDRGGYQAVFLTGGQVFFGHATVSDEAVSLTDVFYLAPNTDSAQSQQVGQLVKRGTELHGPREPMLIEVRQVLFIENMRDDSQIVQAIKRFKSGEQPAPATQAPAPTQAPATSSATARPSASR